MKEISGLEVHIQEDVELKFGILAPYWKVYLQLWLKTVVEGQFYKRIIFNLAKKICLKNLTTVDTLYKAFENKIFQKSNTSS